MCLIIHKVKGSESVSHSVVSKIDGDSVNWWGSLSPCWKIQEKMGLRDNKISLPVNSETRIWTQLQRLIHSFQPNVNDSCLKSTEERLYNSKWWFCCSVAKSCLILGNPKNFSMPGFPVLHYIPEFAQTHVQWVSNAIQPSHLLSPPCPTALNLSQHQGLFQWVGSFHQVAKGLEMDIIHKFCVN